ncbi:hypothetical protein GGR57DRAFT_470582 [Xylariaceae sp. FL1272]|nr:hypothetical protein GGR57DRAFT_470582 [Xylariaceae sp. FL1272]
MSELQDPLMSQTHEETVKVRDFPWEYPIPNNKFWADIPLAPARTFLQSFSAGELAKLPIDPDSTLEVDRKLVLLLALLREQLAKKEADSAPDSLYDADYATWEKIHMGIFSSQRSLKDNDAAEVTVRMLIDRRKDRSNLSLLQSLDFILMDSGKYGEVEQTEQKIIEWLNGRLGKDSPQALGSRRILAEARWYLGEKKKADDLLDETKKLAESMADGQYAKYRDVEVEAVVKLAHKLHGIEA